MFENLSYQKKFFALLVFIIIMGITSYKRSFSLTIDAYQTLDTSREKLLEIRNSPQKLALLKTEVESLDRIIGKEAANADIVQQEILNAFNTINNNAELVKLEEIHIAKNDYFNIYTNRLVLTGNYEDLLKTIYHYEKKFDYSRVIGSKFYIDKEPRTRRKKLYQQIIFQNYEKIH